MSSKGTAAKNEQKPQYPSGEGITAGIALGVVLGLAMENLLMGIAMGIALGSGLEASDFAAKRKWNKRKETYEAYPLSRYDRGM